MAKETEFMLTTVDNPFDPFDNFDEWRMFDIRKSTEIGMLPCCEYLAKFADISDEMTQKEQNKVIEQAIDEIITYNSMREFKKVSKEFDVEEVELDIELN